VTDVDYKYSQSLPTSEVKPAITDSQNADMSEPDDTVDNVQRSQRSEAADSMQPKKTSDSDSSLSEYFVEAHTTEKKTEVLQALSFAVYSEEPSTKKLEDQPDYLPALSDLALSAVINDVPKQPLVQGDAKAPYAVFSVQPRVYELSVEVTFDIEMPEIDAVQFEICASGHFVEAVMKVPMCECRVLELVFPEFDDFVVYLQSPETETATVPEVEISADVSLTVPANVELDEKEVCVEISAPAEMASRDVNGKLSLTAELLPATEMKHDEAITESDDAAQDVAADLPETPTADEQPCLKAREEIDERLEVEESVQYSDADLSVMWKYTVADRQLAVLDPDGEMPAMVTEFSDSHSEQDSMTHFVKEDRAVRTHVEYAELESATLAVEYRPADSEDENDTETATSDEWLVMEKEQDAGCDATLAEEVYEHVPPDDGDVCGLAGELVYASSTDETFTGYTTCTCHVSRSYGYFCH